jgi:hypothetical protein
MDALSQGQILRLVYLVLLLAAVIFLWRGRKPFTRRGPRRKRDDQDKG